MNALRRRPRRSGFQRFLISTWIIIKETVANTVNDNVFKLSAALSYYTIFSLAPLLIIIIRLSSVFYGRAAVEGRIFDEIRGYVGNDAALQIQGALQHLHTSSGGILATVIGVVTLVIGATAVFSEIQDSVNLIWKIKAKPRRGWLKVLINRLLSFSLIISLGFLLIVTLAVDSLIQGLSQQIESLMPELSVNTLFLFNQGLMIVVLTILFGAVFKVLPDARIAWKNVLVGALVTALLFMLGKSGLAWYLGQNAAVSAYGAAGSIILILLWVYYSAVIIFIGAEFTHVYALRTGSRIRPNQYAVFIDLREVELKTPIVPGDSTK